MGNYTLDESSPEEDDGFMAWSKREYGKAEIDRMGALLVHWWRDLNAPEPEGTDEAYEVIQNWRSSHGMPLLVFRGHLTKRAEKVSPNAIVAQRLKRLSSIMKKLVREPTMKLSQMQDLGGCRAIMPDMASLNKLWELYRTTNDDFVHKARAEKNEHWNGQRIEIQLRTKLQHAFSTAVETVTAFTRLPLKSGGGPADWRRFFSLVGTMFAIQEGTPPVPDTPSDPAVLKIELRRLMSSLRVRKRLRGWTQALLLLPKKEMADARWILLVLDVAADSIQTTGFTDAKKAVQAVAAIEKSPEAAHLDAVLVGVNSIKSLGTAYPNYYADTAAFVSGLNKALHKSDGKRKKKQKRKRKTNDESQS
jgi:hypothetical protein